MSGRVQYHSCGKCTASQFSTNSRLSTVDVGTGGAEGAAAPPTFGTGEQAIVLAFCTAMSQIDLDIAAQKAQTFGGAFVEC